MKDIVLPNQYSSENFVKVNKMIPRAFIQKLYLDDRVVAEDEIVLMAGTTENYIKLLFYRDDHD